MSVQDVAVAFIRRESRYLLQRRPAGSSRFPSLWELPGGKVEPHESPVEGLLRELREELGWSPATVASMPPLEHAYEGFSVHLHPFLCLGGAHPQPTGAWGWFTREEMLRLPLPGATRLLAERLDHPLK